MKIDVSEVKRGTILKIGDWLWRVAETSHMHKGRGSATYGFKIKNIQTGQVKEITHKAASTLESAEVAYKNGQYLYCGGDTYTFMEFDTSELYELSKDLVSDILDYLKENMDLFLVIYEDTVIGVLLPEIVIYEVTDTMPGVKGDRSQAGTKPATLETWAVVEVPLYIENGDKVEVNTTTNQVRGRVK